MTRLWRATVDAMSTDRGRWIVIFTALIGVDLLVGNASTPLWDQDEAAYAGFGREMVRSGDWLIPHFLWSEVHRKPPFLFWCIGACFKLFGESEFAVRLPSLLAVSGTFLATVWLARPLVGPRAARLASMALGASLLVPTLGKVAVTDSFVLFADTLVALGLWRYVDKPNWRWLALFAAGLAMGLLAKGPPTLILAGGLLLWITWKERKQGAAVLVPAWLVAPLAVVPFALWVYLAWRRDPGFIKWMWEWYVERRATGGTVFGQFGPPGYHLLVLLLAMLPWSMVVPMALARWRERLAHPKHHFLFGWLLFGWLVWELMPSKLPAYAIGGYPAMALLIGRELDDLISGNQRRTSVTVGLWISGILASAFAIGLVGACWKLFGLPLATYAVLPAVLLLAGTWEGARGIIRGDSRSASKAFATGTLLCVLFVWVGIMPAVDEKRGIGHSIARAANAFDPTAALPIVYAGSLKLPSVPFYVGARHPQQETVSDGDLQKRFSPCQPGIYVLKPEQMIFTGGGKKAATVDGWSTDGLKALQLRVMQVTCRR